MFPAPFEVLLNDAFRNGRKDVENYLIVGTSDISSSAFQLAQMLGKSGEKVEVASAGSATAQISLNFRSRRYWLKTVRAVEDKLADRLDVVIDSAGFAFPAINKPKWQNRRMEEWRRVKLAIKMLRRSRKSVLLINFSNPSLTPTWFTILLVLASVFMKPFSTKIANSNISAAALFKRILGKSPPPEIAYNKPENLLQIQGITDGESGLARNAKMSIEAFRLAGITTNFDSGRKNSPASTRKLNASVALHHANANWIPPLISTCASSINIGFLLWELETVPQSHLQAGEELDDIWVPSSYVQKIYQRVYGREVINVGKSINLPDVKALDLSNLGVDANQFVFLTCFDAHSSVERKNPLAAVKAFLLAFADTPNVRMIIKTTPIEKSHWGDPNGQMATIENLAEMDPRIIIDSRLLPFSSLLAMIKRSDCVVSAHRAEGFGYIPAYALSLAKPLVVTNYSGTADFCTDETAFPIGCKPIETKVSEIIEPVEGAFWADVDVESMASAMREVFEHPALAAAKALVGQTLMRKHYSPTKQADRYLRRLTQLGVVETR